MALEVVNHKIEKSIDDISEINEWLKNQKGNYSIDDDRIRLRKGPGTPLPWPNVADWD